MIKARPVLMCACLPRTAGNLRRCLVVDGSRVATPVTAVLMAVGLSYYRSLRIVQ